jgi:hypothetical protein
LTSCESLKFDLLKVESSTFNNLLKVGVGQYSSLGASHSIHREHNEGEVAMVSLAERIVFGLLLLLVSFENFGWVQGSVRRRIRIRPPNVEASCRTWSPEAVSGDVSTEFGMWLCARGCLLLHVTTGVD